MYVIFYIEPPKSQQGTRANVLPHQNKLVHQAKDHKKTPITERKNPSNHLKTSPELKSSKKTNLEVS